MKRSSDDSIPKSKMLTIPKVELRGKIYRNLQTT